MTNGFITEESPPTEYVLLLLWQVEKSTALGKKETSMHRDENGEALLQSR